MLPDAPERFLATLNYLGKKELERPMQVEHTVSLLSVSDIIQLLLNQRKKYQGKKNQTHSCRIDLKCPI